MSRASMMLGETHSERNGRRVVVNLDLVFLFLFFDVVAFFCVSTILVVTHLFSPAHVGIRQCGRRDSSMSTSIHWLVDSIHCHPRFSLTFESKQYKYICSRSWFILSVPRRLTSIYCRFYLVSEFSSFRRFDFRLLLLLISVLYIIKGIYQYRTIHSAYYIIIRVISPSSCARHKTKSLAPRPNTRYVSTRNSFLIFKRFNLLKLYCPALCQWKGRATDLDFT